MHEIKAYTDDEDGRYRAVIEVRVPAPPEQVWRAIATGEGHEAWYIPAEIEPEVAGRYVIWPGQTGSSTGVVTVWEPPHRFAYDEDNWRGPDVPVPTWNSEFVIEPLDEGGCLVRLSSGLLSGTEGWHEDVERSFSGWMSALLNLRTYLTHFADQPAHLMVVQERLPTSDEAPDVVGDSGLRGELGREVSSEPPAPPVHGTLIHVTSDWVTVLTDEPGGILELTTTNRGGATSLVARWYLYGAQAEAEAERRMPQWREWAATLAQQLEQRLKESGHDPVPDVADTDRAG